MSPSRYRSGSSGIYGLHIEILRVSVSIGHSEGDVARPSHHDPRKAREVTPTALNLRSDEAARVPRAGQDAGIQMRVISNDRSFLRRRGSEPRTQLLLPRPRERSFR